MELVQILSAIILVATVGTFILAFRVYILYKNLERKYQQATAPAEEIQHAKLVEPEQIPRKKTYVVDVVEPVTRLVKPEVRYRPVKQTETLHSSEYVARTQKKPVRKKHVTNGIVPKVPDSRYLKYSEEGYVVPAEDRDEGEIKWR